MAEPPDTGSLGQRVDRDRLLEWLRDQRWFASKTQSLIGVEVLEEGALNDQLALTLTQVQFATGGHELYQILLAQQDGRVLFDVLTQSGYAHALMQAIDQNREVQGGHGRFYFRHVNHRNGEDADGSAHPSDGGANQPAGDMVRPDGDGAPAEVDAAADQIRAMGAEQSNSSIVFGDRLVLKLFRKLESGINPELEMLRFLTVHGYPNIAPLHGWYEYEGETLAATLAVVQDFVRDGRDGWDMAIEEIPSAPDTLLERLASLGSATAKLHSVLSTDSGDPAFSPEESNSESLGLLRATLDEELERVFGHLPDDPNLAPIADLELEVRELITVPSLPVGGMRIRIHGDYHLGQTLYTPGGWTLLDFEGEPARPLIARRAKRSPLRDVASMLRSFSYAIWAVRLQRGLTAPEGFEDQAREAFLGRYFADVDARLLPAGQNQIQNMLAIFELEKALYELKYELDNRPDWVPIPVAGIARIVESHRGTGRRSA